VSWLFDGQRGEAATCGFAMNKVGNMRPNEGVRFRAATAQFTLENQYRLFTVQLLLE
jgi:hypothetical protein